MSDRPLSERVRAFGWTSWGDLADEIAALEVERDRLRGIVYWAHYTGRTRCLCSVCVAYGANPTALEGGDDA